MFSSLAFFITLVHWLLIAATRLGPEWHGFFTPVFLYPSPVLFFFSLLDIAGVGYTGEITRFLVVSAVFNLVKYFILIRAIMAEERNFRNVSAMIGEAAYLCATGWYLTYYSYT